MECIEGAQAYEALCSFCSWVLLTDLTQEDAARLSRERDLFAEPPFSQVAPQAAAAMREALESDAGALGGGAPGGGAAVAGVPDAGAPDVSGPADGLHRDRTYLFYMLGQSHTSPFESAYRTDDATVFGPTTLQVRAAYKAHGLEYANHAKSPDDHLGLELAFVAHLLQRGAVDDVRVFLSDHVLVFAPLYLEHMAQKARTPFYRAFAQLCAASIGSLAGAVGAQASDEPKGPLVEEWQ